MRKIGDVDPAGTVSASPAGADAHATPPLNRSIAEEIAYCIERERNERASALAAASTGARNCHVALADRYALRAAQLGERLASQHMKGEPDRQRPQV